uniref:Uncharacterized protein n=1 Tax=Siphoviridae sp. ctHip2 TaxID=2827830 RepID=A0A8S5RW89_9CAUD|nr:MAG TPA: hypothetical protein [Siphoviridae sp. ctHip2]
MVHHLLDLSFIPSYYSLLLLRSYYLLMICSMRELER